MKAVITVMPKDGVPDPQGQAIGRALAGLGVAELGVAGLNRVRAGKVFELALGETDPTRAHAMAEEMARRLLANPVIERFVLCVTD